MNRFYGFTYEFLDGKLSNAITTDEETIKSIPEERHSVGDIPMVVKCVDCGEYMILANKEEGNPYVGKFVCPTCKRSIDQYDIFLKISDEAYSHTEEDGHKRSRKKLSTLYSLAFDGEKLSDFDIDNTALMKTIIPEKYSVGDGVVAVKCVHCNKDMVPRGKLEEAKLVCEDCGRSISQHQVLKEIEKNVEMAIKAWNALPLD